MHFRGLLFDLDGTLVNSLDFVEASWSAWAVRKGVSAQAVRHYLHGKPAVITLRHFMPEASDAVIEQEFLALEAYETSHVEGITPVPGAVAFLQSLNTLNVPWAIVTSGSLKVASARIHHAGLPFPDVLVTSEDITRGKPDPEPFLLGAQRLNIPASHCVALEDSHAGLLSAQAAQGVVVEVLTAQSATHDIDTFATIPHYQNLSVSHKGGAEFFLRIENGAGHDR
ncbi:HAD-IA family hydrolase [Kluyvera sp. SCKS090646]|uniref:HAD-IA family hydrolase n=1 Tax=Kluyvera sichuanensis TaxID=2725494 RepID=A0ABR6RNZ7_9ENTR|nr:HAD-IA family hydrolase [Kluyvera sichuanensis]MBC1184848.1 HAD-IA family hydrolase [Kluyvera sichuanensis]